MMNNANIITSAQASPEPEATIKRKFVDLITGDERIEAVVTTAYQTKTLTISRDGIFTNALAKEFVKKGIPLPADKDSLSNFVVNIYTEEGDAEICFEHDRLGFVRLSDNRLVYLGHHPVGGCLSPPERRSVHKAGPKMARHGSLKTEYLALKKYISYTPIALSLVLAFAGAVTYLLKEQGVFTSFFVVNIAGESSSGKTFTMRNICSFNGNPHMLMHNFNATINALVAQIQQQPGVTYCCDEATHIDGKYLESFVYMVTDGKGRSICNPDGSLKDVAEFSGGMLISSEVPIIEVMAKRGGLCSRVLTLENVQWFPSAEVADELQAVCLANYGHLYRWVIKKLLSPGYIEILVENYSFYLNELKAENPDASKISGRILKTLAMILTTAKATEDALKIGISIEAIKDLLLAQFKAQHTEVVPIGDELYDKICNDVFSHARCYPTLNYDRGAIPYYEASYEIYGLINTHKGADEVWLTKNRFEEIVHDYKKVGIRSAMRHLNACGHLIRNGSDRYAFEPELKPSSDVFYRLKLRKPKTLLQQIEAIPKEKRTADAINKVVASNLSSTQKLGKVSKHTAGFGKVDENKYALVFEESLINYLCPKSNRIYFTNLNYLNAVIISGSEILAGDKGLEFFTNNGTALIPVSSTSLRDILPDSVQLRDSISAKKVCFDTFDDRNIVILKFTPDRRTAGSQIDKLLYDNSDT